MQRPAGFIFMAVTMVAATMGENACGDETTPLFKIVTRRDNDKVAVQIERSATVFSIQSPIGISQAEIERTQAMWPERVVMRLHLKGLESFRASNGKIALVAAVSSHNDQRRARLWLDDKEDSPLDRTSPFWTEIRMVGGDGKPASTIPLKDGYFELQLPKAFFEANPASITLNWIDFYRN
jgi:hypothetical protein